MPIELHGSWDEGYAFDEHTISSTFLGYDQYNHPQFDTVHSEIGSLIYKFKYNDDYESLDKIIDTVTPFLVSWHALENIDFVLPVPPSKERNTYQPTFKIAQGISEVIGANFREDVLVKTTTQESKSLSTDEKHSLHGTITMKGSAKNRYNILLVDDVYKSGATISDCVRALHGDKNINKIYVFTITKTRKG